MARIDLPRFGPFFWHWPAPRSPLAVNGATLQGNLPDSIVVVTANKKNILARFDAQVRRDIVAEPGIRIERTSSVVRVVGLWNCVLYSKLDDSTVDREIATQLERFRPLGTQFEWKLYDHDQPSDLGTKLARAGFEPEQKETFLVFDLRNRLPSTELPPGISVREVGDARSVADAGLVGKLAFGIDFSAMIERFLARLPLGTVKLYVAYDGTEPVAAARLETPPNCEFAGLYGGGTVPAHRRRGLYRGLVGIRAREALRCGYRYLNIDAADESLPILQRLGFVALTTVQAWIWRPD